jgi:hypothetical protein
MKTIVVTVTPSRDGEGHRRAGSRGLMFDAAATRTVVRHSSTPLLDDARALLAEGIDPATPLVMRHQGVATTPCVPRWVPPQGLLSRTPLTADRPSGSIALGMARPWCRCRRPCVKTSRPLLPTSLPDRTGTHSCATWLPHVCGLAWICRKSSNGVGQPGLQTVWDVESRSPAIPAPVPGRGVKLTTMVSWAASRPGLTNARRAHPSAAWRIASGVAGSTPSVSSIRAASTNGVDELLTTVRPTEASNSLPPL